MADHCCDRSAPTQADISCVLHKQRQTESLHLADNYVLGRGQGRHSRRMRSARRARQDPFRPFQVRPFALSLERLCKGARDGNEFVCNVDCAIRMQTSLVGGVARAWGRVVSMLGVHVRDLQPFVRCVPRFAPVTCAHIVVQVVEGIPGIYIYHNWSNGAGCVLYVVVKRQAVSEK